ncbi:glycoside hydrolase family 76 protein [Nakamurella leprariae]|uniref:Glycoside hydrolase family 76 protein n=1 Tax=Nakamurella leprariae TaxID=2803911 RepID=A0A938YD55_9ACTN|nr:glycoside hydrolase family 76 protein [Nakamurella leprariae]MBM9466004.1 glycoside hydrolase family 76 protein [Nakamurella leprariae]
MRVRRPMRLLGFLVAGTLLAGCGSEAPSEVPAVDALVGFYDQRSGVWPTTGWWNSANALTAVTDFMLTSGDRRYQWVVENTWTQKRNAAQGNFINELIDDTGWWALAWIRAYDLTGESRYLDTARTGIDFMWQHADDTCGGGLWWTVNRTYKNAITNQLFVKAAAELGRRLSGEAGASYVDRAVQVWDWFEASGMINDDLLINDGLNAGTCRNNGQTTWTYNQGVVLGALVALEQATGREEYLERARELADASTDAEALHVDDVLTEPCEDSGCGIDAPSFKGIYVRNLGELNRALEDHPYSDYLVDQATTAYEHDRTDDNQYGLHWGGPVAFVSAATQQSAVDLLVAAQPVDEPEESSPEPSP